MNAITTKPVLSDNNPQTTVVDSDLAFREAIAEGRLSNDVAADNYAGNYMYIYTANGIHKFKHHYSRKYI